MTSLPEKVRVVSRSTVPWMMCVCVCVCPAKLATRGEPSTMVPAEWDSQRRLRIPKTDCRAPCSDRKLLHVPELTLTSMNRSFNIRKFVPEENSVVENLQRACISRLGAVNMPEQAKQVPQTMDNYHKQKILKNDPPCKTLMSLRLIENAFSGSPRHAGWVRGIKVFMEG